MKKGKERDRGNGSRKRNIRMRCSVSLKLFGTNQCLCNAGNKGFYWKRNLIEAFNHFSEFSFKLFGNTVSVNTTSTPSPELRPEVGMGQQYPLLLPARFHPSPASVPQGMFCPNGMQQDIFKTSGKYFYL